MTSDMTTESAFDANDYLGDDVNYPPLYGPRHTLHRQGPPHRRRVRSQPVRQTINLEPIAFDINEVEDQRGSNEQSQIGFIEENLEKMVLESCGDGELIASSVGDKTLCVICLLNHTPERLIVQLKCKHTFCMPCITQWLKKGHLPDL